MHGRTYSCLLALLVGTAGLSTGQSDRAERARSLASSDVRSRIGEPVPIRPHQPAVPSTTFGLPQLAKAAGMIFSARVAAVAHRPATDGQTIETVAITFHVDNVLRGATPGDSLTITQWIGLWSSGQRYRVGERVLLFLYAPSKLGLTSCVGGTIGRFNIDAESRVLLSSQQLSAFRADPVIGGKSRVSFRDFALAVQRASQEE